MASSPERISSGASATAAAARRPMASLTLASTSAGLHQHRIGGRGLHQGGRVRGQHADGVQQESERGQHLGRRLERASDQQQVAHSAAPPLAGAVAPQSLTTCINRQGPGGNSARVRLEKDNPMAKVTIQYWAAAREAAGVELESVEARTLAEALDVIVARRADDDRLRSVLAASSFLVDGTAAGRAAAADVVLPDAAVIEVLPQFAGG